MVLIKAAEFGMVCLLLFNCVPPHTTPRSQNTPVEIKATIYAH